MRQYYTKNSFYNKEKLTFYINYKKIQLRSVVHANIPISLNAEAGEWIRVQGQPGLYVYLRQALATWDYVSKISKKLKKNSSKEKTF